MSDTLNHINAALIQRLSDAEATLEAIREGSVDAIVVQSREGQQVYTLESMDLPYRQFLEQMGEGAISLDFDARIVYCNRFFVELVAGQRAAILGEWFENFIEPEYRADYCECLKSNEPRRIRAAIASAHGEIIPVQLSLTPTGNDTERRWVIVVSDLSQLQRLHAISAAHEAAEAGSLAKDHFIALVGHELRTPLAVMMGWADYLLHQSRADEAKMRKALATIKRNAQLQQKLIEDLLDISRIASGKMNIDARELDISALGKDVAAALALRAESEGIELCVEIGEPLLVFGDPQRLEQVFTNILGNAIKFTARGGRVRFSVHGFEKHARISVEDTGIGIDAAMLPRIFQIFRQGDAKKRRESGLGLGLAITKHLIELHNGTVTAQSDGLGRGATFSIELPALDLSAALHEPTFVAQAASEEVLQLSSRILVIDDEQEIREVTSRLLRSFGAEVVDVIDATSALAWLENEAFDLIISDLMMPGIDGLDFARTFRRRFGGKQPLLALTALSGATASEQARQAGFNAILTKPVSRYVLYRAVNDLLVQA